MIVYDELRERYRPFAYAGVIMLLFYTKMYFVFALV